MRDQMETGQPFHLQRPRPRLPSKSCALVTEGVEGKHIHAKAGCSRGNILRIEKDANLIPLQESVKHQAEVLRNRPEELVDRRIQSPAFRTKSVQFIPDDNC